MGAQESAARGKADVLEIGEEYSRKSRIFKLWSHVNPCKKNKRVAGTVFTKKFGGSVEEKKIFEHGVKLLKQLRHPGVVTFLESSETPEQLSLMTERVQVLDLCIDTLSFVEIHSGLRQLLDTIIFLHEKAKIFHNNISPSSIFVCSNGEWKLGGFEFAHPFESTSDSTKSKLFKEARDPKFCQKDDSKNPDSYAFGRLIEYVLENHCAGEQTESDEDGVNALKAVAEGLTTNEETDLAKLRDNYAFSNDLTNITDFLSTIHLKGEDEKETFFKEIEARLRSLPVQVVSRRLCRLALSRYVLLEPLSHLHLYPYLLEPVDGSNSGILPLDLYRTHLIPEVVRVFCVKEVSVRLGLLAHFDRYVYHIPREHLERFVLDEVLLGAHDVDDRLVAASLRAMADLVGILGADVVCDWKLTKNFVDSAAKSSSRSSSSAPPAAPKPERSRKVFSNEKQLEETVPFVQTATVAEPSRPAMNGADWEADEEWSDNWNTAENEEDTVEEEEQDEKEPVKVSQPLKLQTFVPAKPVVQKENSIGSSFEIKVARSKEDDFFADMAPEIKTSGTLIDKLMAMKEEVERKEKDAVASTTASKFAMAADLETDSGADWGEDAWEDSAEDSLPVDEEPLKKEEPVEGASNGDDPAAVADASIAV